MIAPDTLPEAGPAPPRMALTRDDFPYSLRAYAMPFGEDGAWSLLLYRATDVAERDWLRAHGFSLQGRLWVRAASVEDS